MKTRHFRDLLVWQKSMALAAEIYALTERFPRREIFGLSAQMRRSAVSVPSNIAEGHGRLSDRNLAVFLGHARGSLFELECQTGLARQLSFADAGSARKIVADINEVARMLNALLSKVQPNAATTRP
ncbi:MAG TPA: four helix bundle protein [Acidobacteriaceae bacterium]|nr:four helix bundle protein [Acidobacteriaceae bacterium]